MLTVTYIGTLPSGSVRFGDESAQFVRGKPLKVSEFLGRALVSQDPASWKVDEASADALQKAASEAAKT